MFSHGEKFGHGVLEYENGDSYDGDFAADEFNGQGKFTDHFGNVYDGLWKNGEQNGKFEDLL